MVNNPCYEVGGFAVGEVGRVATPYGRGWEGMSGRNFSGFELPEGKGRFRLGMGRPRGETKWKGGKTMFHYI